MKRLGLLTVIGLLAQFAFAQQMKIINSINDMPIAGALAISADGRLLGVSNSEGVLSNEVKCGDVAYVSHFAFEEKKIDKNSCNAGVVKLQPLALQVVVLNEKDKNAEYVRLRGRVRNFEYTDGEMTFYAEGMSEYYVSLKKKKRIYRDLSVERYNRGRKEDLSYKGIGRMPFFPLLAQTSEPLTQLSDGNTMRIIRLRGKEVGSQQNLPAQNSCIVDASGLLRPEVLNVNLFGLRTRGTGAAFYQVYNACKTAGEKYGYDNFAGQYFYTAVQSGTKKKMDAVDVFEYFYVTEVEYLSKKEMKEAVKAKSAKISSPTSQPMVEGLQKGKAGLKPAKRK